VFFSYVLRSGGFNVAVYLILLKYSIGCLSLTHLFSMYVPRSGGFNVAVYVILINYIRNGVKKKCGGGLGAI